MGKYIYYSAALKEGGRDFLGGMFMESRPWPSTPRDEMAFARQKFMEEFYYKQTPIVLGRAEFKHNQVLEFDIKPHLNIPYIDAAMERLGFKDSNIEFDRLFGWVSPDQFDEIHRGSTYIAVKKEAWHLTGHQKPIHSQGLEKVDGHDWEIFHSDKSVRPDRAAPFYYGMFVEGIGAFDVMVREENIRTLTDGEKEIFKHKSYGMHSGFTGELSYPLPKLNIT